MTYLRYSDAGLFGAVDDGVREVDQWEGVATFCPWRTDAGEVLDELRDSFEFVKKRRATPVPASFL